MTMYCVERKRDARGEHLIHRCECKHMPPAEKVINLGDYVVYHGALAAALRHYDKVAPCEECLPVFAERKQS